MGFFFLYILGNVVSPRTWHTGGNAIPLILQGKNNIPLRDETGFL
jgi:hypothetical protein